MFLLIKYISLCIAHSFCVNRMCWLCCVYNNAFTHLLSYLFCIFLFSHSHIVLFMSITSEFYSNFRNAFNTFRRYI